MPTTKTAPVKLLYDYWPDEDTRKPRGEVIELPTVEAKAMIANGKAVRADPMPGDNG